MTTLIWMTKNIFGITSHSLPSGTVRNTNGDHFYYKEKAVLYKAEDVKKRALQAAKKGKLLFSLAGQLSDEAGSGRTVGADRGSRKGARGKHPRKFELVSGGPAGSLYGRTGTGSGTGCKYGRSQRGRSRNS